MFFLPLLRVYTLLVRMNKITSGHMFPVALLETWAGRKYALVKVNYNYDNLSIEIDYMF